MEKSCRRHFMPKYGDIKELLAEDEVSFTEFVGLVQRYGSYNPPPQDLVAPALAKSIEILGGWIQVCHDLPSREDHIGIAKYEAKFMKAAETAIKKIALKGESITPLIGRNCAQITSNCVTKIQLSHSSIDKDQNISQFEGKKLISHIKNKLELQ